MSESRLTMIPGPTPVRDAILRKLAIPTCSHQDPSFVDTYRNALNALCRIVRTEDAHPFIVGGGGTLGMEMALINLLDPDDRLLVVSHGFFGDRWEQLANAFGFGCDVIRSEWGRTASLASVVERVDAGDYRAVAITHVDTSTGVVAPLRDFAEALRGRDTFFIVDGVCATAAVDEPFDEYGIDVLLTGPQKAIGAPPGVALEVVSGRAIDHRRSLDRVQGYYADWTRWLPVMENPALYFSTPPVNEIVALEQALQIVLDEGLDRRFARHQRLAAAMRAGMESLGLRVFADSDCRADTLSVLLYPDGVEDGAFRSAVAGRGVVVAGALGPIAGKGFRVGHMGNIGAGEVGRTLQTVGESLVELGVGADPSAALDAASNHLIEEDEA
ncbi:MAG: alanine--glyoxylate aminotransferase family protein [Acidobacteriota bacterium]|nr:alanine--glyoxylate aminotransferase family protein [Acidobacteriota bacterium]